MKSEKNCILTINNGSSSIKFSLYQIEEKLVSLFDGAVLNTNTAHPTLHFKNHITDKKSNSNIKLDTDDDGTRFLINWLEKEVEVESLKAVVHRIVQGLDHTQPQKIDEVLLVELKTIAKYDSTHFPRAIKIVETIQKRFPALLQIACFDTSFHTSMPQMAKLLPLPRRYFDAGIKRYGFHGISYSYIMKELERLTEKETVKGKIILAHLGNGASMAAVNNGKCIDTSMSFSPASGMTMGTRSGDIDPNITIYMLQQEKITVDELSTVVNEESGLLGISATTYNMQTIIQNKKVDKNALEAFEIFCYQAKKYIGSYTAALGGLQTLVFSGGIGENAHEVRSHICAGLQFLGIEMDAERNENNSPIISTDDSKVCVRVIETNEALMMAILACEYLKINIKD
jgi:acetate kinase